MSAPTVDEIYAGMSDEKLNAGLKRAFALLEVDDIIFRLDFMEGDDFDGPFPPSKALETWLENYRSKRERVIKTGIRDIRREIDRRACNDQR